MIIKNCSVHASNTSYLLSKRNKNGTVVVADTVLDNTETSKRLVYNGKALDMTGFTISGCTINGYETIANSENITNAMISNTTLNGVSIN